MEVLKTQSLGVKETLEVLEGARLLMKVIKEVLSDGKISLSDIAALISLMKEAEVLTEAIKGAELSILEIKDLDQTEAQVILAKVFEILSVFKKS